jgi:hypothetical protein
MMIDFKSLLDSTKSWYARLPWYWKVLAFAVLIIIGLLWVLSLMRKDDGGDGAGNADALVTARTDEALAEADANAVKLQEELNTAKRNVAESIKDAHDADVVAGERRGKILAATSMEELDRLQKEYGL